MIIDTFAGSAANSAANTALPHNTENLAESLVARARAMIPELAARAADGRRNRRVADATIQAMAEAGFFRVLQPARWGGYEMTPETFYDIQMALAEGDMSVGWVYAVLGVHPWLMGLLDDRAARDLWGEDDGVRLCSSLIPVGKATAVDGGFRLSGHWRYSSGCHHARWALLGGIVAPGEGGPGAGGPPDVRLFMVPQADYRIAETWHVCGLNATGSEDILVEDAFVPEHRTRRMAENFQCTGAGQALNPSPLYRIPFGQVFFRGVSSGSIGALRAMLEAFTRYAQQRDGVMGKASDDPVAQQICAETAAALDEMVLVLHRNMRVLWQHAERGTVPPLALRQQYKFQSSAVSERCTRLAARLLKATGAAGLYDEHPFGRLLADMNAGRQHIANQFELTGRNWGASLLGGKGSPDFML